MIERLSIRVLKKVSGFTRPEQFCDTAKGAHASALCFSMIETAKLHSHHVHQYMTVLLTELPKCKTVADYETLLPWNITPAQVDQYYKSYPIL